MNNQEAITLLERELAVFRDEPYRQLVDRTSSEPVTFDRVGPSGATYQFEIQTIWEDRPGGNILVMGSVDDGGWRAFVPLTRSFIKTPDGSLVGG